MIRLTAPLWLSLAFLLTAFAHHLFSLDRWTLYPDIWTARDGALQMRGDCMVQLQQAHSDGTSVKARRAASEALGVSLTRMIHARALPAAHFAIEPDPALVTLTFVSDCARRHEAARLLGQYHALMDRRAPRFQPLPGPARLGDTAFPATGPAWRDGQPAL